MNGDRTQPTIHDDASRDPKQFKRRQLARDRDLNEPNTLLIDESNARRIVKELIAEKTVDAIPEDQVLVHLPSGEAFDSDKALAYFHKGWAAREQEE